MDKVIELKNVSKYYGTTLAVDHLSLAIDRGELCVLIGPSGCGKTTVAKMINRLIEPSAGNVYVNGKDVMSIPPQLLRRQIGYVIQSVGLFPHLTVQENVRVVPELVGWEKNRIVRRVDEVLNLVSLEPAQFKHKYPRELSGGEAQRVGVARALAADPQIIIMDEPFGAVDPLTREKLHVEFLNIHRQLQKTVVFITHFIDEAIRLADKIAIMKSGKIVQYETTENILAHPADTFVKDFLGTDRALKRLLKLMVQEFMHPVSSVTMSSGEHELCAHFQAKNYAWVTDEELKLLGWVDKSADFSGGLATQQVTFINPEIVGIRPGASLNEALSKMLDQGIKTVPVVDADSKLLGEISLEDIAILG